jgi:hypothetical protein
MKSYRAAQLWFKRESLKAAHKTNLNAGQGRSTWDKPLLLPLSIYFILVYAVQRK